MTVFLTTLGLIGAAEMGDETLFGVLLLGARTASDRAALHISNSVRPGLGEHIQSEGGTSR